MGAVTVQLPAVLAQMVEGERIFSVGGATIGEALEDLVSQRPALHVHLFDESGGLRPHVICFHNDEYARGLDGLTWPVSPGDRLTILNSITGGGAASG
jgi:sulfur-carrier protein